MKKISGDNWKRKEHFAFFSAMKSPFFGLVTEVDCTIALEKAKASGKSFFAYYMHKSMSAVNQVPEFRYRLIDGEVYELDVIHAGATIGRPDETFGFAFVHFSEDFQVFNQNLQEEINAVMKEPGLRLNNEDQKVDLIRHSTIPWHSFTGLLNPTNFNPNDSVPKITFGKFREVNGRKMLPLSVEAHHGLMDGLHISKYLQLFQDLLNE